MRSSRIGKLRSHYFSPIFCPQLIKLFFFLIRGVLKHFGRSDRTCMVGPSERPMLTGTPIDVLGLVKGFYSVIAELLKDEWYINRKL